MTDKSEDTPVTRQQRRHQERQERKGPITSAELLKTCGEPDRADPSDPAAWGGKLNIYTCEQCRSHIVTRDVDEGVTPFMLPSSKYCPQKCGVEPRQWVNMSSSFYRVWDQRIREDYQWYRPKDGESYDQVYRDHVERGGLILRPAE